MSFGKKKRPASENSSSKRSRALWDLRLRIRIANVFGIAWCALAAVGLFGQTSSTPGPGTALYRRIGNLGLDPNQVYNVRDAGIDREDVHISLEEGTLAFTEAVNGRITGALFDGEGTVLIVPPDQVERHSLGMFTGSAVLNQHFTRAYFRFYDSHFISDLRPYLQVLDEGTDFVDKQNTLAKTMSAMDSLRLLLSLTRKTTVQRDDPRTGEFIHGRFVGPKGTFDVSWDTGSDEQIAAGQTSYTNHGVYYDQWLLFPMRSMRERAAELHKQGLSNDEFYADPVQITGYHIVTQVRPPTELSADATLTLNIHKGGDMVLLFELSRYLKLSSVVMESDGGIAVPLEFVQNEALEGTQLAIRGNDLVAVVFPGTLIAPQKVKLRFTYAGAVLSEAGGGLLYVGARGAWFPNRGPTMSNFDLEFEAPPEWKLLATGKLVSQGTRNGMETNRWVSERPMPLAGFNLGKYTSAVATSNITKTQAVAYAASGVERAFPTAAPPPQILLRGDERPPIVDPPEPMPLVPAMNVKIVAEHARDSIDFLAPRIGPFPYSSLLLTQIPGSDSQGWPGLVFLSSHVFLTPEQRSQGRINFAKSAEEMIYGQLMEAHETAHQWWGDAVFWRSYRDQWLMEALANYCALLEIESHSPEEAKALRDYYRKELQTPAAGESQPRKNAGPVSFGVRLNSAPFPGAYDTVAYGRGTWLIHMLRQMLRDAEQRRKTLRLPGNSNTAEKKRTEIKDADELFYSVLRGLQEKFAGKMMSTLDVQTAFEEVWPDSLRYEGKRSLDWFFDGWVNGTAIPKYALKDLRFTPTGHGRIASAKLLQDDAPDSLVTSVPIYAQTAKGLIYVDRVFADGNETSLKLTVPAETKKLVVDPFETVLRSK